MLGLLDFWSFSVFVGLGLNPKRETVNPERFA